MTRLALAVALLAPLALSTPVSAADLPPTAADVPYGPHERNKLDFWKADSKDPTPLVVFIHGGGFVAGDKSKIGSDKTVREYTSRGISFASINYRYRTTAPIQDVLRDCARAIQFLRSKAGDWNIDKTRVAAYGGSAGAGTSLWLAFHDDLADPTNPDPILRESSRLTCAGANSTQYSYDVVRWKELFGEQADAYKRADDWPGFYGLKTEADLASPEGVKLRADCDMVGLITKDDPPVFLATPRGGGPITNRGELLHHPKHAEAIYKRCRECGIEATADLPGLKIKPGQEEAPDLKTFLVNHLKPARTNP